MTEWTWTRTSMSSACPYPLDTDTNPLRNRGSCPVSTQGIRLPLLTGEKARRPRRCAQRWQFSTLTAPGREEAEKHWKFAQHSRLSEPMRRTEHGE